MKIRFDMHFHGELSEKQEKVLQGYIYSYYAGLEKSLRFLSKGKDLPSASIMRRVLGNDGGVTMMSTLAQGQLDKLPTTFICERVNETRDRYFLQINVGNLQVLKIHTLAKDYGQDLCLKFEKNFDKLVKRQLNYTGKYDLIKTIDQMGE